MKRQQENQNRSIKLQGQQSNIQGINQTSFTQLQKQKLQKNSQKNKVHRNDNIQARNTFKELLQLEKFQCRICLQTGKFKSKDSQEQDNYLLSPCQCSGSIKYIHFKCLKKWIQTSQGINFEEEMSNIQDYNSIPCQMCHTNIGYFRQTIRQFHQQAILENIKKNLVTFIIQLLIIVAMIIGSIYIAIILTMGKNTIVQMIVFIITEIGFLIISLVCLYFLIFGFCFRLKNMIKFDKGVPKRKKVILETEMQIHPFDGDVVD